MNEVHDGLGKLGASVSGGQLHRLCIERSFAVQPTFCAGDEPCWALDPIATWAIDDLTGELEMDYTTVIATRNKQQAARVSDHTGFLHLTGRC